MSPRRSALVAIALVALVWSATLLVLDGRGLWTTDNANKLLQLQAATRSNYTDYALPWPGREIDPDLQLNPVPAPFSHVVDGAIHSQYPPLFATLSSMPYRAFGHVGLYLLPLACSVLMLAGVYRLAAGLALRPAACVGAVLLAGLGTPLWFYAVVFWEHAIAVCLCVWAVHFHRRFGDGRRVRWLLPGALLATAAVGFRQELILFCSALALWAVVTARGRRVRVAATWAGGAAAVLLPLLLFQAATVGNALGFHVASNLTTLGGHLSSRGTVFYNLFVAAGPSTALSVALALPCCALLAWNPRLSDRRFGRLFPFYALLGSVAGAVVLAGFFLSEAGPIAQLLRSNSLFPAAPLILLALARGPDRERESGATLLWIVVVAFVAAYWLAAPKISSGGIHWGNRFLLPAYPLLAVLAARNLARWRGLGRRGGWAAGAVASVLALSLVAQLYSISLLDRKKTFSARINAELARRDEPIVVSDVWWVPQALYSEFYRRPMFLVRSPRQLGLLADRLERAGHGRYLFVTAAGDATASPATVVIDDDGLEFFSLQWRSFSTSARRAGDRPPS